MEIPNQPLTPSPLGTSSGTASITAPPVDLHVSEPAGIAVRRPDGEIGTAIPVQVAEVADHVTQLFLGHGAGQHDVGHRVRRMAAPEAVGAPGEWAAGSVAGRRDEDVAIAVPIDIPDSGEADAEIIPGVLRPQDPVGHAVGARPSEADTDPAGFVAFLVIVETRDDNVGKTVAVDVSEASRYPANVSPVASPPKPMSATASRAGPPKLS